MREVFFIRQNKEKWLEIEQVIDGKIKKNPDDLSSLYINLVNDLSFSQTYYPKSNTTIYLNHLSSQIFQKIYKTKRIEQNRLLYFFKTEVPLLVYKNYKFLLYAFCFFLIFTGIGVLSAHYDTTFVELILGEGYVNMTIENIEKGNAVGVYQQGSNFGSAVAIILNNLRVGAYLFIFRSFCGTGNAALFLVQLHYAGGFSVFFLSAWGAGRQYERHLDSWSF